jgi:GT2 family glycosyltransferase
MSKLSIIIVTYNSAGLISYCLESVFKTINKYRPEVVVVDNHSSDGTAKIISQNFPQVKLIVNADNFGFARAANQAAKVAKGEYFLLLNPDAILVAHSVERLVNFLDEHKKVGIVGGQLIGLDRQIQSSFGYFPSYGREFFEAIYLARFLPWGRHVLHNRLSYYQFKTRSVDWVAGGYTLIRQKLFWRLKGFDEKFFMYLEDVDFCHRARKAGAEIYYFPRAKVIHVRQASFAGDKDKAWRYADESLIYYFKKYRKSVAVAKFYLRLRDSIKGLINRNRFKI